MTNAVVVTIARRAATDRCLNRADTVVIRSGVDSDKDSLIGKYNDAVLE